MMQRLMAYDRVSLKGCRIEESDQEVVFKDAVIAREIVQPYEDGKAFKPADELEAAAWTADGRWITLLEHPQEKLLMSRDLIHGKMAGPSFVKNLKDAKTGRPNSRGIRTDVHLFKKQIHDAELDDTLKEITSGERQDVSIGFTYLKDETPGKFNGDSYDFVQRDIFIDHLVVGCDEGRCPMPLCGLGADALVVGKDPEETETEIRIPRPGAPDCTITARITLSEEQGIQALYCGGEKEIRTYIFLKEKDWTMAKAQAWVEEHKEDALGDVMLNFKKDQTPEDLRKRVLELSKNATGLKEKIDASQSRIQEILRNQDETLMQLDLTFMELEATKQKLFNALLASGDTAAPAGDYSKAPEDEAWNYDESTYDIDQLSEACSVIEIEGETHPPGYHGDDLTTKGDCKLPHHKPGDGSSHGGELVWSGVATAGAALMGARGGIKATQASKDRAASHLATHYREFDKVPPWEQDAIGDMLVSLGLPRDVQILKVAKLLGGMDRDKPILPHQVNKVLAHFGLTQEQWDDLNETVKRMWIAMLPKKVFDLSAAPEKMWFELIDWRNQANVEAYGKLPADVKAILTEKKLCPECPGNAGAPGAGAAPPPGGEGNKPPAEPPKLNPEEVLAKSKALLEEPEIKET